MKVYNLIGILIFCSLNLFASSLNVTTDISVNTLWAADTVLINKELLQVKEGARLTIAPGTQVVFVKAGTSITVFGTITAVGALNDSITITRLDPSDPWMGIRLIGRNRDLKNPDSSFFDYCVLKNANYGVPEQLYERQGGILHCGAGNYVSMKHCSISKVHSDIGGAIYCDSGSTLIIEDCYMGHNINQRIGTISGGGAIMTSEKGPVNLFVKNCLFEYNSSRNGGAIRIGNGTTAAFNNCTFYRDTTLTINPDPNELMGGALAIFGPADVTLRNCLIFFCSSYNKGGAIYSSDALLKVINCTIVQNKSTYGGGCFLEHTSQPTSPLFVNSIIDANGTVGRLSRDTAGCGVYLDTFVTPIFRHCQMYDTVYDYQIKKYTGECTNCKTSATNFAWTLNLKISDSTADGYQLHKSDPAIDAGTPDTAGLGLPELDLAGNNRINGTAIDLGAFEYYKTMSVLPYISDRTSFRFIDQSTDLEIYTPDGQRLACVKGILSLKSVRDILKNKYPAGMYFVTLKRMGKQFWSQSIVVR